MMKMEEQLTKSPPQDARKVFREKGTCSHTFFHLLNREFGQLREAEELAADPLAGGIIQKGYQCGMLWGSTLAVGAEAYRRCGSCQQAIAPAIRATQHLLDSFAARTGTHDCREFTQTDFSKKWQMMKYMLFKARRCFDLAEEWGPEAFRAAEEGLSQRPEDLPEESLSCASEVAREMGASEEQQAMVAGFAGGMGLSGNACGALAAAIWMNSLAWSLENPGKSPYGNPRAKSTLDGFYEATGGEILCEKITGRRFADVEGHSQYIRNGGCARLIEKLAAS